jgi:hypothetical protein
LAAGSAATAAAASGEEDPLLQSYDLLNMRLGDLPATRVQQQQQQQQQQPAAALEDDEDDEIVLIDESEEQEQLGAEGGCCYSEIESDAEEQEEQRRQQQQQQQQGAAAAALQQRQLAAQPQQQQQQQQQRMSGSGSVLGKRPVTQTLADQQQYAANAGASAGGSQAGLGDENCAGSSGRGAPPLLAAAGPGRGALQHGPGKTFIRNTAAASIGLDRGKYISSGPDGKGGVASAYHSGGTGGAGGAGGVRVGA